MNRILYIGDTSQLELNENLYNRLLRLAPSWRLDAINKLKFHSGKCQSLGAFLLLYKALSDIGRIELLEHIDFGTNGKPHLPKGCGIFFNLSHSKNRAICLISDTEVGCDIEFKKQLREKLAERFFLDSENALLSALNSEKERIDLFYRLWTLRESYMKVTGRGMEIPLNSFGFEFENSKPKLIMTDVSHIYKFQEFFIDDSYAISCCFLDDRNMQNTIQPVHINYTTL